MESAKYGVQLGRWIRARRHALGMTQEQIAERIDPEIESNYVAQLESGRKKGLPNMGFLVGVAGALHCPLTDVLRGAGVLPNDDGDLPVDENVENLVQLVAVVPWNRERLHLVTTLLHGMMQFDIDAK